jgi:hypothetical protein
LYEHSCVTLAGLDRGVADSYMLLSKLSASDLHAQVRDLRPHRLPLFGVEPTERVA